jgi:sugar phosphate isomerase/epimerase
MRMTELRTRLGLNVPHEWWPSAPMLKEIEASGLAWVQLPAPPASVLSSARECISHARAVTDSLEGTGLRRVLHAPTELLAGEPAADRALAGAISYASECGAEQVVYHARCLPDGRGAEDRLLAETRSLASLATLAERVGVVIAIENLAPVWPGPEMISANPLALRALARRIGSPALGLCLDVGHANVIAGLRRTSLSRMVEPVLDSVVLFHVHDNLGGRWGASDRRPGLDPLRLDLHLPPGSGSIDWEEIAPSLLAHAAPLLLEVHPPRPAPRAIADAAYVCLTTIDSSELPADRQRSIASSRAA